MVPPLSGVCQITPHSDNPVCPLCEASDSKNAARLGKTKRQRRARPFLAGLWDSAQG
jgi:hypothetical protein